MSRKAHAATLSSDDPSVSMSDRWRRLFGTEPPLSPSITAQGIAWREQVLLHGDVAPAIANDLLIAARQASEARLRIGEPVSVPAAAPMPAVVHTGNPPVPLGRSEISTSNTDTRHTGSPLPLPPARHAKRQAPLPPASSQLVPGARLVKLHAGKTHVVEVTPSGFAYEGAEFASLSAVAKHITGTHWNGLLFFGLRRRKTYPAKRAAHG